MQVAQSRKWCLFANSRTQIKELPSNSYITLYFPEYTLDMALSKKLGIFEKLDSYSEATKKCHYYSNLTFENQVSSAKINFVLLLISTTGTYNWRS